MIYNTDNKYEFIKDFLEYKKGQVIELEEHESEVLKNYVVPFIDQKDRLKNLKEASISHLKKLISHLENNKYDLAFKMTEEHDAHDSTVEYIDFNRILAKSLGQTIFFESGDIGTVIRILAGAPK